MSLKKVSVFLFIALALLGPSARFFLVMAADPVADYGDAPDGRPAYSGVTGRFPTKFSNNGARHLTTVMEWLGPRTSVTSREAGAEDATDPDGAPNLPGFFASDGDKFDDGLVTTFSTTALLTLGTATGFQLWGVVKVSVASSAESAPLYLNTLVDVDRNGLWMSATAAEEWTTKNLEVTVAPGDTKDVAVNLGVHLARRDVWVRVTLTRAPIPAFTVAGFAVSWDGKGEFARGETEDYLLTDAAFRPRPPGDPTPPPYGCLFNVYCDPKPLFLVHGELGLLDILADVYDPAGLGCTVRLRLQENGQEFDTGPGPFFGLFPGLQQGAAGVAINGAAAVGVVRRFFIQGREDPPARSQWFDLRVRVRGVDGTGNILYGASLTCVVAILHDEQGCPVVTRSFVPRQEQGFLGQQVNFFGTFTPCGNSELKVARCNRLLESLPAGVQGVLQRTWTVAYNPTTPSCDGCRNIFFQWDDIFARSGIQNSTNLRAGLWDPTIPGNVNGFYIPPNQTSDVRMGGTNVPNPVYINGIWIVALDANQNGVFDFQEGR
jgi:hypothetical protein